ncbi:MAG: hypothetical protein R2734_12055 [Nocardioides sp.]
MDTLRVGVIGAGWMGHVHARAYRRLGEHWPDLAVLPAVVAAGTPPSRRRRLARAHGEMAVHADCAGCWPTPPSRR